MNAFHRLISTVFAFTILLNATPAFATGAGGSSADDDYDRLDGTGLSGKKVQVIEWEGNLEVHVYPAGSLKGLALKLDKRNKDKPVMVIGYRFDSDPKNQLIRRAILGIPFREGFKAYRDKSADDYDKIIISNNTQSGQVVAFQLDPEPTQLYPDGHPGNKAPEATKRDVASVKKKDAKSPEPESAPDNEEGQIKPFFQ